MIRRPTSSTRTDTLFPCPTLFLAVVTRRLPELPGETGHRSLAVGAGDDGDRRRLASVEARGEQGQPPAWVAVGDEGDRPCGRRQQRSLRRSEEHTSELQSLMRISYAVFCLKKKT